MTNLIGIPADLLPDSWPEIEPFINALAANGSGRYKTLDYVRAIAERDMQLWAALDDGNVLAIMLSEMRTYPNAKVARLIGVNGGDMAEWVGHMPQVERWAKIQGASVLEACAPVGWERVLKPYGFKKTHVVLEKPL